MATYNKEVLEATLRGERGLRRNGVFAGPFVQTQRIGVGWATARPLTSHPHGITQSIYTGQKLFM